eukprot:TRINITY_DN59291_c0_g1_i1.p1 TRINITY_DN59291_c0_g1~~TRINITY_DN59291_c0_g1_i1.p1  ORF type:complete len:191 (-),score=13.88 TRINITY_DN59291_c0_g1_i1:138-710(-)
MKPGFVEKLPNRISSPIKIGIRPSSYISRKAVVLRSVGTQNQQQWEIRMLYDGDCPLCMREVNFLKDRDSGKDKIDFVDISSDDYSPIDNQGISYEQAMGRIHAILPDGKVITDIEVFRRLYEAVGLGWVYAITKNKNIENLANVVYDFWAKYRTQITGRPGLEVILEKRRNEGKTCADDATECELPNMQ